MPTINEPLATEAGQGDIATAIQMLDQHLVDNLSNIQTRAEEAAELAEADAQTASDAATTATNKATEAFNSAASAANSASDAQSLYDALIAQGGHPFQAATVADMTDTTKIYVYTGSETGYTNGDWYYYDGSDWVSGGVYNAVAFDTDETLSISGAAADAQVTGDAIASTKAEMSLFGVDDLLWDGATFPDGASRTINGITYTGDVANKTIRVSGTATGIAPLRFYYATDSFPAGMVAGGTYIGHLETDADITLYMSYYKNNEPGGTLLFNSKGVFTFTIPSDATGCLLRLNIVAGTTVNATVRPFISTVPSLGELAESMKDMFATHNAFSPSKDLNTVLDVGSYFIGANSSVTPHSTNPLGDKHALLCVYKNVLDDDNAVTQVIYSINTSKNYIRRYSPASETWTEWTPFVDDTNYMKKLGAGVSIPASTDFDDLIETGYAFINAGTTYVNNPPVNGGVLVVYNTGSIITQYAYGHKTIQSYVRRRFNGAWSDWVGNQGRKSIKYLAVGNSGSQDMLSYVPWIMKNVAPDLDITIGITYISGGTIDQQIDAFDNDTLLTYDLYRAGNSSWTIYANKTLKECLLAEDWDIISIQLASSYQMVWTNYAHVPDLIDRIVTYVGSNHTDYVGHPVKVGYLAPQVRIASNTPDAEGKYRVIETPTTYTDYMDCVQRALNEYPLEFAIMSGTAVQTARKETTLDQYGKAEFNDGTSGHMNADYSHLQEGIGCMVASYASTLFLLDLAGINNRSVFGEGTRPDLQWVTDKNIPGKNPGTDTSVVGISDANCLIAQKCAIMAHKKPFEVSTIY